MRLNTNKPFHTINPKVDSTDSSIPTKRNSQRFSGGYTVRASRCSLSMRNVHLPLRARFSENAPTFLFRVLQKLCAVRSRAERDRTMTDRVRSSNALRKCDSVQVLHDALATIRDFPSDPSLTLDYFNDSCAIPISTNE